MDSKKHKKNRLLKVCVLALIFAIIVGATYEIFQYSITTTKPAKVKENIAIDEYDITTLADSNSDEFALETTPYSFLLTKTDDLGDQLNGATFILLDDDENSLRFDYDEETKTYTYNEEGEADKISAGSVTIENLQSGEYTLIESEAPNGYEASDPIIVTVDDNGSVEYEMESETNKTYFSQVSQDGEYSAQTIADDDTLTVNVTICWTDGSLNEFKDDSVMIYVYQNEAYYDTYIIENPYENSRDWYGTIELPKYDENGVEYTYTFEEEQVSGYEPYIMIERVDENTFSLYIENSLEGDSDPDPVELYVYKNWENDEGYENERQSIDVTITLSDGRKYIASLNEENNWQCFVDYIYIIDFNIIDYRDIVNVEEKYTDGNDVTPKYIMTWEASGVNSIRVYVTNTYENETETTPIEIKVANRKMASITVNKIWEDNNNQDGIRPESVTVHLLADGEEVDSKEIIEEDDWKYTFENVPVYNNGVKINYTIIEDTVDSYSVTYDGYNIINKYTPDKTSVTVVKTWDDEDDQDGIRPTVIEVELLRNGEATGNLLDLNKDNNWEGSFTVLDKYENGEEIKYSVQEIEVDGYESQISGDMETGFVIKNVHEVEVVEPEILDELEEPDDNETEEPNDDEPEIVKEVVVQDVYKSGGYKSEIIYTGTAEYVSAILIAVGLVIIIIAAVFMVNRKNKVFVVLIIIGIILAVVGILLVYNTNKENSDFEEYNEEILTEIEDSIDSYENEIIEDEELGNSESDDEDATENVENEELEVTNESSSSTSSSRYSSTYVTTLKINDYNYMGILTIPALDNLSLPVLNDCTDDNLKKSICRYDGTAQNNDLIIAGHRYKSSFGKLQDLNIGDVAYFKDVDGNTYKYKLVSTEILKSSQGEELESGDWDMTLFTCDYTSTRREVYRFEIE